MASADLSLPTPPSIPVPLSVKGAHRFLRFICTSNPFYVISAGLFLFGLKISFGMQVREVDSWALMGGLSGYTLLLAGAALMLVRFARVWNDVRTVLLLVVLMFLATSVTFDELLVMHPERGRWFFIGGLVFSMALTEGLLYGIRLHLPLLFRLPYHLALALFFLYPLALVPFLGDPHGEKLMWGLWGFAPAAGLVFLTLIPAIRRGRVYLRDNGSPWPWPFYPWSVFVSLAVAVCGRAFLLCWSFQPLPDLSERIIFAPYFLVPFGLVIAVIVLEIALVEKNRSTRWVALAMPLALVPVAAIGHRPEALYTEFLGHFSARLGGTPLFIALIAAGVFYLYGFARRASGSLEGLSVVIAALAVVEPGTLTFKDMSMPRMPFLAAAILLQVLLGLLRRDLWRLVVGASVVLGWCGAMLWRGYRELRQDVVGLDYLAISLLLLPIAVLISLGKGGALARRAAEARPDGPAE